jgi:hypothetical protein
MSSGFDSVLNVGKGAASTVRAFAPAAHLLSWWQIGKHNIVVYHSMKSRLRQAKHTEHASRKKKRRKNVNRTTYTGSQTD